MGDGNNIYDGPGLGDESEADSWADHDSDLLSNNLSGGVGLLALAEKSSETSEPAPSLMPEPFGINEVLEHFKRTCAPTLLVRISAIIEEVK